MDELIPVIFIILFAVGSVIKKVGESFSQQKDQNEDRNVRPQSPPRPTSRGEAPQNLQEDLMRKLQEALSGASQNVPETRETEPSPPPLPQRQAQPVHREKSEPSAYESAKPSKIKSRMQMPIKPIRAPAESVKVNTYDHLAVIQSPRDLQRAILAQEILGLPRSKRPWNRVR